MARRFRSFVLLLSVSVFTAGVMLTGCSRHPNEKQMKALEESTAAVAASEDKVAQLEKENAELKAKLAEKQQELKNVQAEKAKILSQVGK
jgi:septal ring factor EnvC (AmiA/AmiB activator)